MTGPIIAGKGRQPDPLVVGKGKGGPTASSQSQSDDAEHQSKRKKLESGTDSDEDDLLGQFDPASLVKSKEGTFSAPSMMKKYLNKHMKCCLSKEERDAILKEHPKPDLHSCSPPKVDKYISDFLGKRLCDVCMF